MKIIVEQYEQTTEHLGRDNKRLQVSLKELVGTNRLLREHVNYS